MLLHIEMSGSPWHWRPRPVHTSCLSPASSERVQQTSRENVASIPGSAELDVLDVMRRVISRSLIIFRFQNPATQSAQCAKNNLVL